MEIEDIKTGCEYPNYSRSTVNFIPFRFLPFYFGTVVTISKLNHQGYSIKTSCVPLSTLMMILLSLIAGFLIFINLPEFEKWWLILLVGIAVMAFIYFAIGIRIVLMGWYLRRKLKGLLGDS